MREPFDHADDWTAARRVYPDLDLPERERESAWLLRASIAYKAGNPVHLPRMIDTCNRLDIAPPHGLSEALAPIVRSALLGERYTQWPEARLFGGDSKRLREERERVVRSSDGGRSASVVARAAQRVREVEALMVYEQAKESLGRAKSHGRRFPRGYDAYAVAHEMLVAKGLDAHGVRDRVKAARQMLRDPVIRHFIGANFPPSLLDRLARSGHRSSTGAEPR